MFSARQFQNQGHSQNFQQSKKELSEYYFSEKRQIVFPHNYRFSGDTRIISLLLLLYPDKFKVLLYANDYETKEQVMNGYTATLYRQVLGKELFDNVEKSFFGDCKIERGVVSSTAYMTDILQFYQSCDEIELFLDVIRKQLRLNGDFVDREGLLHENILSLLNETIKYKIQDIAVIWLRSSGSRPYGAHPENDDDLSSALFFLETLRARYHNVIITGDKLAVDQLHSMLLKAIKEFNKQHHESSYNFGKIINLIEFWNTDNFGVNYKKPLGQVRLFDFLHKKLQSHGSRLVHFGLRSGNLEFYPLIKHCVNYIMENPNLSGYTRMMAIQNLNLKYFNIIQLQNEMYGGVYAFLKSEKEGFCDFNEIISERQEKLKSSIENAEQEIKNKYNVRNLDDINIERQKQYIALKKTSKGFHPVRSMRLVTIQSELIDELNIKFEFKTKLFDILVKISKVYISQMELRKDSFDSNGLLPYSEPLCNNYFDAHKETYEGLDRGVIEFVEILQKLAINPDYSIDKLLVEFDTIDAKFKEIETNIDQQISNNPLKFARYFFNKRMESLSKFNPERYKNYFVDYKRFSYEDSKSILDKAILSKGTLKEWNNRKKNMTPLNRQHLSVPAESSFATLNAPTKAAIASKVQERAFKK